MQKINECRWSIRQSEWPHYELEMPIPRPERCLRDVYLPNSQLMVTGAENYLGVDSISSQLIKHIINPWQRVPILNSNLIQLPIIYA